MSMSRPMVFKKKQMPTHVANLRGAPDSILWTYNKTKIGESPSYQDKIMIGLSKKLNLIGFSLLLFSTKTKIFLC